MRAAAGRGHASREADYMLHPGPLPLNLTDRFDIVQEEHRRPQAQGAIVLNIHAPSEPARARKAGPEMTPSPRIDREGSALTDLRPGWVAQRETIEMIRRARRASPENAPLEGASPDPFVVARRGRTPGPAAHAGAIPVIQARFSDEQRAEAKQDLDRIEAFLAGRVEADPPAVDRTGRRDMALGVTELRENRLGGRDQRDLLGWLQGAQQQGDEPEILARCQALLARAEGRANNSNLRIFGDRVAASTWMDWVPVDPAISGQYRTWFAECATKPLLAKDGRFKFNLSGFNSDYTKRLVADAAVISQQEMDRRVDAHEISKTDWEILEVLSNPALFRKTDFLLFNKKIHDAPTVMTDLEREEFGVDRPIVLVSHPEYLARMAEKQRVQAEAEAEAERFRTDKTYRAEMMTRRFEAELLGTGKSMTDKGVKAAFEEAMDEIDWFQTFNEWWDNGPADFFRNLKGVSK